MVQKVNVSLREQSYYINRFSGNTTPMETHHMHQDYEIFYLLKGERVYIINEEEYSVKKHQLVFIDKNIVHKTSLKDNQEYERIVINFRDDFLSTNEQSFIKQLFEKGPHVLQVPDTKKPLIDCLIEKQLNEYHLNEKDRDTYIRSLLIQLLVESNRILEKRKKINTNQQQNHSKNEIAAIITFINNHYEKDISLRLLADHFHLNEQYISRLFKKFTGCSFIDYLNAIRINEAKRLLNETTLKVHQIARRVGYSNNVHLWRVFKRLTAISPNEYRLTNPKDHKTITELHGKEVTKL